MHLVDSAASQCDESNAAAIPLIVRYSGLDASYRLHRSAHTFAPSERKRNRQCSVRQEARDDMPVDA